MRNGRKDRICGLLVATVVWWAASAAGDTTIWPLFGRETPCVYCDALGDAFGGAERSIDVLLSTFDAEERWIVAALGNAHARGVAVRVLLDGSSWAPSITDRNRAAIDELTALGIDARFDDPDVTTHAKLAIVDRSIVVMGSTNWNRTAFTQHRQADVRIDDPLVGEAFAAFFDRVWESPGKRLEMAFAEPVPVDGGPAIVALPDVDGTLLYGSFALELIAAARRSVRVAMYRVSVYPGFADSLSNRLVDALVAAVGRGVEVQVLIDDCSPYPDSAAENLESAITLYQRGVDVRFDRPAETTHAKLLVVDGEHVLLGSTNWNYYAIERNVEASVAFVGLPEVAGLFDRYVAALFEDGRTIGP
jgi:phosphatidylserine/phosphatidylglycerophosphate/cardiolipin synthase-like enzyme